MVEVQISRQLIKDINKRLSKKQADAVFLHIYSLEGNPFKGDVLSVVGSVVLKEICFESFRFYFIHSQNVMKCIGVDELKAEIFKFIAMSDKSKEQQKVINRIKKDLKKFGYDWF